jgi:hypothetical protein
MTPFENALLRNTALRTARSNIRTVVANNLRRQPSEMKLFAQAMIDAGAAIMMSENQKEASIYLYRLSRKVLEGQSFDF